MIDSFFPPGMLFPLIQSPGQCKEQENQTGDYITNTHPIETPSALSRLLAGGFLTFFYSSPANNRSKLNDECCTIVCCFQAQLLP